MLESSAQESRGARDSGVLALIRGLTSQCMVGMGGITEIATSAPGYSSRRPNSMAPLGEILRLNGYSTA